MANAIFVYEKSHRAGRAPKLTVEIVEALANSLRLGMSITDASRALNLTSTSYYTWMRVADVAMQKVNASECPSLTNHERLCIDFYWAMQQASAERKETLLRRIDEASRGGEKYVEVKTTLRDDGEGNLTVYERVEQTKVVNGQWQAAAWLLERLHPGEFGKRDRVMVTSWRDEVLGMVRAGTISYDDVVAELGDEIAQELFANAGRSNEIILGLSDKSELSDEDETDEAIDG